MLPFDTDATRHYARLTMTARIAGRGFPTADGYIAAIAASRGFIVASRDTASDEAAGVTVINPREARTDELTTRALQKIGKAK